MSQPEDILKYAELNAKNSLKQMLTILNSKFKDYLKEN